MPDDARLVNVSRGSLVNTDAVVDALSAGRLGGAALDVTDPEPLPDGHPLWDEPGALVTPHAGNPGSAQLPRLCALLAENIRRFCDGRPLKGLIDLDNGY